jgi:hypothetical protein
VTFRRGQFGEIDLVEKELRSIEYFGDEAFICAGSFQESDSFHRKYEKGSAVVMSNSWFGKCALDYLRLS